VEQLSVGTSTVKRERLTVDALRSSLERCLRPEMAVRAQALAPRITRDGAQRAAQQLGAISSPV
jgi:hypothetical protein